MIYSFPQSELRTLGTVDLTRSSRAPQLAREALTDWLEPAHPALDITLLAASELVTNAVLYAGPPKAGTGGDTPENLIAVRLSQASDYLRLAVTGPGSTCSRPMAIPLQTPDLNAERGRGLAIVRALSRDRWGSYRLPGNGTRLVWCHLDLEPTAAQIEELFCAPAAG
jgi:anti-sigma regulatory factor (Ser/Thr protein kinase)